MMCLECHKKPPEHICPLKKMCDCCAATMKQMEEENARTIL